MRSIKRIIKIHAIDGYKIYCLFNNGQSRIIDFEKVFREWDLQEGDREFLLSQSLAEFQQVELEEGTLVWKNLVFKTEDEDGNEITYYYDIDPVVLYKLSDIDPSRAIDIGLMIKQYRKEMGLTQSELAQKSGTTKNYISRIENNKSGIELATLKKIIEGGLGKRLEINIV